MVKKVISLLIIFVIMFGCEDVDRIWDNPYDPEAIDLHGLLII